MKVPAHKIYTALESVSMVQKWLERDEKECTPEYRALDIAATQLRSIIYSLTVEFDTDQKGEI